MLRVLEKKVEKTIAKAMRKLAGIGKVISTASQLQGTATTRTSTGRDRMLNWNHQRKTGPARNQSNMRSRNTPTLATAVSTA